MQFKEGDRVIMARGDYSITKNGEKGSVKWSNPKYTGVIWDNDRCKDYNGDSFPTSFFDHYRPLIEDTRSYLDAVAGGLDEIRGRQ